MKQVQLFKKDSKGRIQIWSIEIHANAFRTTEGLMGGTLTTSAWTVCEGKRAGMKNATTGEQQAEKEALAKIEKQIKKGYVKDINDVDQKKAILPMLAKKFEDHSHKISKWVEFAVQPKLDGIRCIGTDEGLFTREGNRITSVPHIEAEVRLLLQYLPEGTKVDGELYNHDLKEDFNSISSIIRKETPNEEQLALSRSLIQYHVYDIETVDKHAFNTRNLRLTYAIEQAPFKYIKHVETLFSNDITQVDVWYEEFLSKGYEGAMVRNAHSLYENKRTENLLKRKEWIEEEFELIDILPGRGNKAGMAASVKCVRNGEEFDAGIIGKESYCKDLLINKDKYIGKMVTIKYQNLTPGRQVPRFAKMKAIRDYE